jgi:hypothetical protein
MMHDQMGIPKLIARDGNPLNTRPCPLIYYNEQLLDDMRHIITHHFETIPRTILNPIQSLSQLFLLHLGTTEQLLPIAHPLLPLILMLGVNPRVQEVKRTHLPPMNISKNWPRTRT